MGDSISYAYDQMAAAADRRRAAARTIVVTITPAEIESWKSRNPFDLNGPGEDAVKDLLRQKGLDLDGPIDRIDDENGYHFTGKARS